MREKLVSVIMGAYNCEKYIDRAIQSIVNQTYSNWELIICDDCSKDNTYSILDNYSQKDSRIKVLKNETNMKLAYTLNKCLSVAKGEYVARMDADDISLPERLRIQTDFLNRNSEYSLVSCRSMVFDESGDLYIRGKEWEPTCKSMIKGSPFMHPTIVMRREVYDTLQGYTVSKRTERGQDLDLWYRFFEKGYKGYILNDVLYKYHESQNDFKKRTVKTAIGYVKTNLYGYRLLHMPVYDYVFAFKPLIPAICPNKLLYKLKGK